MCAVLRVRDAARAASDAACDAELSSNPALTEHLVDVATRVAASQTLQWRAMAEQIRVHVSDAHVAEARQKFLSDAVEQAKVAYKDSKATAAIITAVASLPNAVVDVLGGAAAVQAIALRKPAAATAPAAADADGDVATASSSSVTAVTSDVVETFTVTVPLWSMSPDILIPEEK